MKTGNPIRITNKTKINKQTLEVSALDSLAG
jgi:hypothetical protein